MPESKFQSLVLKGGLLYDGTGLPPERADIFIKDGVIEEVEPLVEKSAEVLDITGLAVSPGFIDAHAHSEFALLANPAAAGGKLLQGITTEINGNCGLSAAPLLGAALSQREADLAAYGIKERWENFAQYFDLLRKRGLGLNFATLAGHGNIRASVVGYEDRAPSADELHRMCDLLAQALREGAIGLSTGLIYPPGIYSTTEELIELANAGAAEYRDFIYTTHMRSEGKRLLESIAETMRIGRDAMVRVHISHIKTADRPNWHKIDSAIRMLGDAREEGLTVTADRYPYTASSTDLDAALPNWVYIGGNAEELKRLRDPDTRVRIASEVEAMNRDWSTAVVAAVESDESRWMEGLSVAEIATRMGVPPVEALLRLLDAESLRVGAIFHSMTEENLLRFLALPYVMIGTDSTTRSMTGKGKPHPRGFGSFPRYLGRYAAGNLAAAIHKCTMLPATTFGIRSRGRISPGHWADLVVFDPQKIMDTATFDNPYQTPRGIQHVFVNGVAAVRDGALTNALAGLVLRNGGHAPFEPQAD